MKKNYKTYLSVIVTVLFLFPIIVSAANIDKKLEYIYSVKDKKERVRLMNELKKELATMHARQRAEVLKKLQTRMRKKHLNVDHKDIINPHEEMSKFSHQEQMQHMQNEKEMINHSQEGRWEQREQNNDMDKMGGWKHK